MLKNDGTNWEYYWKSVLAEKVDGHTYKYISGGNSWFIQTYFKELKNHLEIYSSEGQKKQTIRPMFLAINVYEKVIGVLGLDSRRGLGIFSSPPRPERLWGPPSPLSNG